MSICVWITDSTLSNFLNWVQTSRVSRKTCSELLASKLSNFLDFLSRFGLLSLDVSAIFGLSRWNYSRKCSSRVRKQLFFRSKASGLATVRKLKASGSRRLYQINVLLYWSKFASQIVIFLLKLLKTHGTLDLYKAMPGTASFLEMFPKNSKFLCFILIFKKKFKNSSYNLRTSLDIFH